ncbi:MAG: hypothetical protein R3350_01775 [Saprospiraceae bacterium]|nr:hypothetical protein [Saprospiraceae bacterium]
MTIRFKDRIEAIEWIANYARDEGQFEVLREQLNYNHIYFRAYFLDLDKAKGEVVLLGNKNIKN